MRLNLRIIFSILLVAIYSGASAQDEACAAWVESLAGDVKNASADESKWIKKTFGPHVCSGSVTAGHRADIETTVALLKAQRVTATKGLLDYLHAADSIVRIDTTRWDAWHGVIHSMASDKKLRKRLKPFLEQSKDLMLHGIVGSGPRHRWQLTGKPWYFEIMDSRNLVRFDSCSLSLGFEGDTMRFEGVAGQWDVSDTEGEISASLFPWLGTVHDPQTTFAALPPTTLDFSKDDFRVDSVLFHSSFSQRPLLGKLTGKLEQGTEPQNKRYPVVRCNQAAVVLDSLFGYLRYEGGMDIRGSSLRGIGDIDDPATVSLMQSDSTFMEFSVLEVSFTDRGVTAPHADFELYFKGDTVRHPDCTMRFDARSEIISVTRQLEGMGQQAFEDGYHALEWDVEGFSWKIGHPQIEIGYPLVDNAKAGVFKSLNYFEKSSFDQLQGIDPIHPVVELYRFHQSTGLRVFTSLDYAKYIKLSEVQARVALMNLANAGYVDYNVDERLARLSDKTFRHIGYASGKRDHDIIQFRSNPRAGNNAEWSLTSGAFNVNGVERLIFSSAREVYIDPSEGEVQVLEGCDMVLDGLVHAGNVKLNGQQMDFSYEAFTIDFNTIEAVHLSVNDPENLDYRGRPKKIWLNNSLQDISGQLAIDRPFNRSGKDADRYQSYPEFTSKETSFVYYDRPDLYGGAYERSDFYYAVEPFQLSGLDNLTASNFQLEGTLVSAGIVADIDQPLVVMDDFYMGLTSITPPDGSTLYNGNARFTSALSLDGSGLNAAGEIDFLTAHVEGRALVLLPDSIIGPVTAFDNNSSLEADVPDAITTEGFVHFDPHEEVLELTTRVKPVDLYNGEGALSGTLAIDMTGLNGTGYLDLAKAGLEAQDFSFQYKKATTAHASFELYGRHASLSAFETDDVQSELDFERRTGEFIPNSGETAIELSIQQYLCFMARFRWFMDDDEIDLISERDVDALPLNFSENRTLSNFISIEPNQDSLHFLSTHATYLVGKDVLQCKGVKEIAVADSRVFPDSGLVTVRRDADMDELQNARLISNATTQHHLVEKAFLKIHGRYSFQGAGEYQYRGTDMTIQTLILDEIGVNESIETYGIGSVNARDNFMLDPNFQFAGDFTMMASDAFLIFNGGARMTQTCRQFQPAWIQFEAPIDPSAVAIPIPEQPLDVDGDPLACGMMFSRRAPFTLYPSFLDPLADESEQPVLIPEGALRFKDGDYIISSAAAFENDSRPGNRIVLDAALCQLSGSGSMNLPLDFGLVDDKMVGSFDIDPRGNYHFKGTVLLSYYFHPDLFERMALQIPSWQSSEPLDIASTNYEQALRTWIGDEDSQKLINDLAMTGKLKNVPKLLQRGVVLTDVDLVWDDPEEAWISTSEFGLVSLGKDALFMHIPGKLELKRSRSGDAFTLYFHGDEENWYYHDFKLDGKKGRMNITTSDMTFYEELADLKASKKEETTKDGQSFFFQYMASRRRRDNLVDSYRDFD